MNAVNAGAHAARCGALATPAAAVHPALRRSPRTTLCKLSRSWPNDYAAHAARPSAGFRGRLSTGWPRSLAEVAPPSGARVSRSTPDRSPTRSRPFNEFEGFNMEKITSPFFYTPLKSIPIKGLVGSSKVNFCDEGYPLHVRSYTLCEVLFSGR
jgi:hypothetical protein